MNNKCVYIHKDLDGNIRYIGSGNPRRPFDKQSRSKEHLSMWDDLQKEVILKDVNIFQAREEEQRLIAHSDVAYLLNKHTQVGRLHKVEYETISKYLKIDECSPSCLSWIKSPSKWHVKAGEFAGCQQKESGYYSVTLHKCQYKVHRVVYCLHTRTDLHSGMVVDHIDNNRGNNNPNNLRLVSQTINVQRAQKPNCYTGVVGVSWDSKKTIWIVNISHLYDKQVKTFNPRKLFPDLPPEEAKQQALQLAIAWRKEKEIEYGFNSNPASTITDAGL